METNINQNEALHKEIMSELYQLYVGKFPIQQDMFHIGVIGSGNEYMSGRLALTLSKFKRLSKIQTKGADVPIEAIRKSLMDFAIEVTYALVEFADEGGEAPTFVKKTYDDLHNLYIKKNMDYGDSFHLTFLEEGFAMSRIRLNDKVSRFSTLSKTKDLKGQVSDESIQDTLLDALNYSVMSVMEIDRDGKKSAE
jgi:hypothetical protein